MSEPGETLVFVGTVGEGRPDPRIAAAAELGAAALALAAAALFARLRVRHGAAAAPRRRARAALAALAFSVAFVGRETALWVTIARYPPVGPVEIALRAAIVWAGAALLFAFADAVLARLAARRDRGWLIAAPLIFGILVLVPLRLMWMPHEAWLATFGAYALNGAAGGLAWWSLLPPGPARVARVFD